MSDYDKMRTGMVRGVHRREVKPFDVQQPYRYLRVVDVSDAKDGIGYFDKGLVSTQIRPLWSGMRFWVVAFTMR